MKFQKTIVTLVTMSSIFVYVATASAIKITHTPSGGSESLIFEDDFEDDAAATSATDPANPGPLRSTGVAGWDERGMDGTFSDSQEVQVMDQNFSQAYTPSSASQGNNFLSIARDVGGYSSRAGVDLGQSFTTGVLTAEFMAWVPNVNTTDGSAQVQHVDVAFVSAFNNEWNGRVALARTIDGSGSQNGSANEVHIYGTGDNNTGQFFQTGVWEKWVVETDLDAGTTRVAVGNQAFSAAAANSGGSAGTFNIGTIGGNAGFAIDAVPEPSTFAMLTLGLLLLWNRCGRYRR